MQTIQKTFGVAGVYPNKYGHNLYDVLLISEDGTTFNVTVSWVDKPKVYSMINGSLSQGGLLLSLNGLRYENPQRMQNSPREVINELFKSKTQAA